jgi:hypothetical protein
VAENFTSSPIQVKCIGSIDELAERIRPSCRYFTLMLAWDAPEVAQEELVEIVRPFVERGLVYFCAWGNRCEVVHDAVDQADLCRIERQTSEDYVIMTTWHSNESLLEAFWYFKSLALPAERPYNLDLERFAVAVGNENWAQEISRQLSVE